MEPVESWLISIRPLVINMGSDDMKSHLKPYSSWIYEEGDISILLLLELLWVIYSFF